MTKWEYVSALKCPSSSLSVAGECRLKNNLKVFYFFKSGFFVTERGWNSQIFCLANATYVVGGENISFFKANFNCLIRQVCKEEFSNLNLGECQLFKFLLENQIEMFFFLGKKVTHSLAQQIVTRNPLYLLLFCLKKFVEENLERESGTENVTT